MPGYEEVLENEKARKGIELSGLRQFIIFIGFRIFIELRIFIEFRIFIELKIFIEFRIFLEFSS